MILPYHFVVQSCIDCRMQKNKKLNRILTFKQMFQTIFPLYMQTICMVNIMMKRKIKIEKIDKIP